MSSARVESSEKSNPDMRIAIFYSNPSTTPRLRLDREHRALDAVLAKHALAPDMITRKHAVSVEDIISTLDEQEFSVMQFSGHGDTAGFLLEGMPPGECSVLLATQLRKILENLNLRAIILLSCFSHSSLGELIEVAPYIVTIEGESLDSSAIDFCVAFYDSFFRTDSVERAFSDAQRVVYAKGGSISTVLSRRAQETRGSKVLYQVFPQNRSDSVLVDITDAENDIVRLGLSKNDFVKALAKKMRIHKWLFISEKHRAIIPIGPYFGIFSWKDANDVVTCHNILKVKSSISGDAIMAWAALIVTYNDLFVHRYRFLARHTPNHGVILKQASTAFHSLYNAFFGDDDRALALKAIDPAGFQMTKAMTKAHLDLVDTKWTAQEYDLVVVYLETTLTTFHEYVSSLVKLVTE